MNASWDAELGCPTFKYEGDTYESYSWWYAVRKMAQQCIWMNVRSSKYLSSFITPLEGMEFSGVNEMGQYALRVGEDIDVEVTLPSEIKVGGSYNGKNIQEVNVKIDPFTPLPEGVSFANNHITGSLDATFNKFIHVLVELKFDDNSTATVGRSFELIVLANSPEVELIEPEKPKKKGCGGSIVAASSLMALVAVMGLGVILAKRKEDQFCKTKIIKIRGCVHAHPLFYAPSIF